MSEIGLICEARVPEGSTVEVEVREDVNGDGEVVRTSTQALQDGTYKYILTGFEANRNSRFETEIHFTRESTEQNPSVLSIELIIPGVSDTSVSDPRTVLDKHREASFFLQQMKSGEEGAFRYYLSGFLSAAYSIDELIDKKSKFGFRDWAESEGELDLHNFLMENRNASVHLLRPAHGTLRPGVGHVQRLDFGASEEESTIKMDYLFTRVPRSVLDILPDDDSIELAEDATGREESPVVRSVPAISLCELYETLMLNRLEEWLESSDEVSLSEKAS